MFTQQAAAGAAENIGTVTQVYDGTLTSDIQVRTFRNIDRLTAGPGTANQGAFQALGIYGQHIYVNPAEHVVIVVWSALPKPTGKEVIADQDFFAAATAALR